MGSVVPPVLPTSGLVPLITTGMRQFIIQCKLRDHVDYPTKWKLHLSESHYIGMTLLENDGSAVVKNYHSVLRKYYEE